MLSLDFWCYVGKWETDKANFVYTGSGARSNRRPTKYFTRVTTVFPPKYAEDRLENKA